MSWRLRGAALLVVGVLAYGLWQRSAPLDDAGALRAVIDGDADREERLACLRVLLSRGVGRFGSNADAPTSAGPRTRQGLVAAMAAVELGDRQAFEALAAAIATATAFVPGPPATGPAADDRVPPAEVTLGQGYLRDLMAGFAAERREHREAAAACFDRARVAAPLYGAELAASLASEGLARTMGERSAATKGR